MDNLNPLTTPNLHEFSKSLSEINQLEIINNVTKPLNNIIESFLNGGQNSIIPSLKGLSNLSNQGQSIINTQNMPNNMSLGDVIDKSKEVFILIAQILIAVLETALWILKSVLGFIT